MSRGLCDTANLRTPEELAVLMTHQPIPRTPPAPSAFVRQVGGEHYKSLPEGYQPFQISRALDFDPVEHTILKYLIRHRDKNGKQDLEKIKHCVDILIEQEYPNA